MSIKKNNKLQNSCETWPRNLDYTKAQKIEGKEKGSIKCMYKDTKLIYRVLDDKNG